MVKRQIHPSEASIVDRLDWIGLECFFFLWFFLSSSQASGSSKTQPSCSRKEIYLHMLKAGSPISHTTCLRPITTNYPFKSVLEPLDRFALVDSMRCSHLGFASSSFGDALAWSGPKFDCQILI